MELNGSQIVLETLKEQGVDTIFGYPGGTILNIFDELYKYGDTFNHILTAHEQGAAHAADGYARATGKVGVCFATSGPGATNLVTGIATAYLDSIPVVAITANVANPLIGRDTFQEVDICGITMPITKHNFFVKHVEDLAPSIRKAFRIAQSGRPGPVLIDIPKDVTAAVCEYVAEPAQVPSPSPRPTGNTFEKAIELIRSAKKPLIYAGGGAILSDVGEDLITFAE
ncbi:MAG: acetolactate synthase large subunit, partial [Ruminococcaceae bacterium]|nr:acetolactate synthase large subunit [Oscillospiraceae bacterium]